MPLPDFTPVPIAELRELYAKYRGNQEVLRVILELQHARNVLHRVDGYRAVVQKVWHQEVGGQLVALENMRVLLLDERWREGIVGDVER